ncbi:hypothetical protein HPB50_007495 [Hyalomma asiaticum]|uniref:Uncharacterized protein n=1 Tax=Hyalomma asiaticum TaxID=266040 RepID=A0ACB7RZ22_HYAAI|nr:hypothetical protein HPB50_007495 [Hyalomma asiaticum]
MLNSSKSALVTQREQPLCRNFSENAVINKWVHVIVGHAAVIIMGLSGLALLPALLLSHRLHQAFFAFFYELCQRLWEKSFSEVRRNLLARLDGMVSHSESLRARGAVRVLEVGAAYGPNLQFVRRPVEYWKVEPNTQFDALFLRNLAANPKVQLERSICGYGENMAAVPDGYFDAVLMTYILCSATDGRKLLNECKRVLAKVPPSSSRFFVGGG